MGDSSGPVIEQPEHRVSISAFGMALTPVTRRQYSLFLQETDHACPPDWQEPAFRNPDQPALSVNWFDAAAYCQWLTRQTGRRFRLPTEAEREYAARGGVERLQYVWGDRYPDPSTEYDPVSWTAPLPVGSGAANGFGLYNMGDTVHEWCQDWYAPDYYSQSPMRNPTGPAEGTRRVSRGGAWRHQVPVSRCAHRSSLPPDRHFSDFGFRVVEELL